MSIVTRKTVRLADRAAKRVPVLDQAPLGHLQALILKILSDLGDDASGSRTLEILRQYTGVWVDHAQIYGAIQKLQGNVKKSDKAKTKDEVEKAPPVAYIKFVGTRKTNRQGPPIRLYEVTKEGRAALKVTRDHYEAVTEFLRTTHS